MALLSKTPLTPHIPLNLSCGHSCSEFPQFSPLAPEPNASCLWEKCHLLFGKKTLVDLRNAIKFVFVNISPRPLDAISDISRHKPLFYFLQTPKKLPPKNASFGQQCFSWIFLRIHSGITNNFLTYEYSGFIFRVITSKCSKTSFFFFSAFTFVSDICFLWCCQLPILLPCTLLYLGQFLHSVSEIFFSIQGLTFYSLIFYLLSSLYS